jgi:hypothetical protein
MGVEENMSAQCEDDGGPAYPTDYALPNLQPGMSLRDRIALEVVTLVYDRIVSSISSTNAARRAAVIAYSVADAMIAERVKSNEVSSLPSVGKMKAPLPDWLGPDTLENRARLQAWIEGLREP